MTPFDLILLIISPFAAYRIARALVQDTVFEQFRNFIGRLAAGRKKYSPAWYLAELFNCQLCVGFWASLFVTWLLSLQISMTIDQMIILWLSIAGIQVMIVKLSTVLQVLFVKYLEDQED